MLLKSADRWDEYAAFDPETGALEFFRKNPARVRPSKVCGAVSELAGRTVVLWNDHGQLHLQIDDERFLLTDDVVVHHQQGVAGGADERLRRGDRGL